MTWPLRTAPRLPDDNDSLAAETARGDADGLATCSGRLVGRPGRDDQQPHATDNDDDVESTNLSPSPHKGARGRRRASNASHPSPPSEQGEQMLEQTLGRTERSNSSDDAGIRSNTTRPAQWQNLFRRLGRSLWKFARFIGPGFMVAVAYIDPGNYATAAAAGASYRFKLLFMVLLSNIFAIFLQALCIKMSTVTGLNLAEMNKAHCPPWLNYVLWFFGEACVIATDIAEVIGFAIALNLLAPKLPLVAGCGISILDVMFILLFYRPEQGSMAALRAFEYFVMLLVLGVAVCFCYQLSLIENATPGEVFKGYIPSSALVESKGLYQACGILGATVMPHSLYLGSGLNQPRLKQFDIQRGNYTPPEFDEDNQPIVFEKYRPSLAAIRSCLRTSISELAVSLFTFALFINSAILIVCGASLYSVHDAADADLFGIYALLRSQLGHAAATVFAVALLLSGCSAGIVCTMAGQMISEGQLNWRLPPWVTRLITRSISIVPAILVAGTIGRDGLSEALVGSQVALSVILPFVSAPMIYYTCRNKYMTVRPMAAGGAETAVFEDNVSMRNHWATATFAVLIWLLIVVMNVANIVLVGLGVA